MFQSRISRLGVVFALAGIAVLAASLFHWHRTTWSQGAFYTVDRHAWVLSIASEKPAIDTDQVWEIQADCARKFYLIEAEKTLAALASHNASKPPDFQQAKDASERHFQLLMKNMEAVTEVAKRFGPIPRDEYEQLQKTLLENKLAIDPFWFATRFHLQYKSSKWKADAASLQNSETTEKQVVAATSGRGNSDAANAVRFSDAKTSDAKYDVAAKSLLSLIAFTDETAKEIRRTCLRVTPIKQIVDHTDYGTDIDRWPVEAPKSFWPGVALLVFGLLLGPMFVWVRG